MLMASSRAQYFPLTLPLRSLSSPAIRAHPAHRTPHPPPPPPRTHTHTASLRIDDNIREEAEKFDATGKPPSDEVYLKMGAFGALACRLGPGKHLNLVPGLPAGIKPDDFDYFHVRGYRISGISTLRSCFHSTRVLECLTINPEHSPSHDAWV